MISIIGLVDCYRPVQCDDCACQGLSEDTHELSMAAYIGVRDKIDEVIDHKCINLFIAM